MERKNKMEKDETERGQMKSKKNPGKHKEIRRKTFEWTNEEKEMKAFLARDTK